MGIIRFLLALSVVLTHSYAFFKINLLGGPLAVQAFFIISGFYMTMILNEKYVNQNGSYKLFITNRFMRIFPIYAFIMLIAVSFSIFSYLYPAQNISIKTEFKNPMVMYTQYYQQMDISSLFFLIWVNLTIFFQDIVMFLGMDPSGSFFFTPNFKLTNPQLYKFLFIPQAWTVGLELTFYLIAPFLVRKNIKLIISIIIIAFAFRFFTYFIGYENDPWNYRFFPFELGYFLLGNVSYSIYKKIQKANLKAAYKWIPFIFILLFTLTYPLVKFEASQYVYTLCFSFCLPFVFLLSKAWKYDTYIGDLSYPMYLVHILIFSIANYFNEYFNKTFIGVIYMASVIAFSIFLNELISKRIEKIRQRRVVMISVNEKTDNIKIKPILATD